MDYVLLSVEEAGQLANVSTEDIIARVEAGELGGMRVAGHWRIPLKTVAQFLASQAAANEPESLDALFNDEALWDRVLAAHPEVSRARTVGEKSPGGLRAYLRSAIARALAGTGREGEENS